MKNSIKTIGVLFLLGIAAIPAGLLCLLAIIRNWIRPKENIAPSGRTVLLTGGKMTKCLQLARMFHAAGDRVIVAETPLYKWCGSRFSKAVDQFVLVPKIEGEGTAYIHALIELAEQEKVDLFVPVASPKAAVFDAMAKPNFPAHTQVFHFDETVVRQLDDKHQFIGLAKKFGLSVPESHHIDSKEKMLSFDFQGDKKYILKKIDYDPVYRLDLRTLPHVGWEERVKGLPISQEEPWVLQEFVEGKEVCTHTTTCNGGMDLYVCSDSSPFQVNYSMLELSNVKDWVRSFVEQLQGTGQISFDFIIKDNGRVIPIECNPRTHSAITLFHNQLSAAAAYYNKEETSTAPFSKKEYTPDEESGHTYWLYHELHRLATAKSYQKAKFLVHRIWTGKEAVLEWKDPWPFFFNNHVGIPYQLWKSLLKGNYWSHIDFNIGKLALPGGD